MSVTSIVEFLFIVAVPLLVVGGVLAGLFALGALLQALENPQGLRSRLEAAFRRPPRPARPTGPDHYYRAYWQSR